MVTCGHMHHATMSEGSTGSKGRHTCTALHQRACLDATQLWCRAAHVEMACACWGVGGLVVWSGMQVLVKLGVQC
jgi:hypothetical protein